MAMHAALASTIVDLVMIPEARGSQETERREVVGLLAGGRRASRPVPKTAPQPPAAFALRMEEIMKHVDTTLARKEGEKHGCRSMPRRSGASARVQDFMVVAVAEGAGQKFVSTGKKDSPAAKLCS